MELYCIFDFQDCEVYTCEGTWKSYNGETEERPVLFLSEKDAQSFIDNIIFLTSPTRSPVLWDGLFPDNL